ncbi:hypothetical protein BY996DRAFT_8548121 [Phakopsora pachyrhizi]|nr:hypothetical protein BY996DRAFT_8548121 [Phakopsora pachyrhizi]
MSLYSKPQNCYPPSQIGYELRNRGHLSSSSANQNMMPIQVQNTFAIPGDQLYYGSQQSNWPTHSALNQPQPNQVLHQLNMGYYLKSCEGLSSPSLHHMRTYKGQSSVSIPEMVPGRVEDLMNTGSSRCYNSIIGTQFPHSNFSLPTSEREGLQIQAIAMIGLLRQSHSLWPA